MVKRRTQNFKIVLAIVMITILILVSCIIERKIGYSRELEIKSIDGISMVIKDDTLSKTGMSIIITDTTGLNNEYGGRCDYRIDKKVDNKWEKMKKKDIPTYLQVFYVNENDKLEMNIDWIDTYGELGQGEYRLVKEVKIKNKYYGIAVEFKFP